nr:TetR/AcrR family transcriptional regulator [uncultured Desulfuromonas sp.]
MTTEQKRKRILFEARRLFVARGFHAVSIPEIVKASEVSTGTVYNHFGSKKELAKEIYRVSLIELEKRVEVRISKVHTTYEKVNAIIEILLELSEINADLISYLFLSDDIAFCKADDPLSEIPTSHLLFKIFAEGIEKSDLCPGDLSSKVFAFYGVVLMNIKMYFSSKEKDPLCRGYYQDIIRRAWSASFI